MLDDEDGAAELVSYAPKERRKDFGLALRHPCGGLVEEQ